MAFNLFKTNKQQEAQKSQEQQETPSSLSPHLHKIAEENKDNSITYEEHGYRIAGQCIGDLNALETALNTATLEIKFRQSKDQAYQAKCKQGIEGEIKLLEQQKQNLTDLKEKHNSNIEDFKQKQENLKTDIAKLRDEANRLKKNPEELGVDVDKSSRLSVIIGTTILTFLTLYLFTFYSSAAYSAFFKVFSIEDGAIASIFDPSALSSAYNDGVSELVLILLIPFVFLGLGFILHLSQKKKTIKGYVTAGTLILVTFLFDAILAYDITKKLYELNRSNSFSTDMPEYSVNIAASDVNFWIIIFSGFLVYIIWGLIFDYTMEAHAESDKLTYRLKIIRDNIREIETKIEAIYPSIEVEKNAIREIDDQIADLLLKITEKEARLDHTWHDTIYLKQEVYNFFQGWLRYIKGSPRPNTQPHQDKFNEFYNKL